ncbi:hypothetical protein I4558_15705 [Proteus mirabilis]|nr:hypothetical protein [Proteus mirabilis]MBG2768809.1 hypothetical protein [Proteus mirabilis]
MTTPLILIKNPALEYLKNHSSTKDFHIQTIGQFFTYLKDSILSLFNSDHKFTYLENKSVAEFNLEHIKIDLHIFLINPDLNNPANKDKADALQYSFNYLQNQPYITPNLYDVYRSGSLEPNELISQLINYGNKLYQRKLTIEETQYSQSVIKILKDVKAYLIQLPALSPDEQNLIVKISRITQ